MTVNYININGEPVALDPTKHAKVKPKPEERAYHKGWRVVGLNAALEQKARETKKHDDKPFDYEAWLRNGKKGAVRSKPYELLEAAEQCMALAEKAGWHHLELVEVKKEVKA